MKTFYDMCRKALDCARKRDTFGTTGCLIEADRMRQDLIRVARIRLELRTIEHVEGYFRSSVQACISLWAGDHTRAFLDLVRDQGMLSPIIERCCSNYVPWDKRVERGSLAWRWAEQ